MTPEEQLAKILKQNQNIVFGKTIGTDADGNCTVQTGESSILARSGGQISAGDCVAMKADDGQWYAVSSRQTGLVQRSVLFSRKNKELLQDADNTNFVYIGSRDSISYLLGGTDEIEVLTFSTEIGYDSSSHYEFDLRKTDSSYSYKILSKNEENTTGYRYLLRSVIDDSVVSTKIFDIPYPVLPPHLTISYDLVNGGVQLPFYNSINNFTSFISTVVITNIAIPPNQAGNIVGDIWIVAVYVCSVDNGVTNTDTYYMEVEILPEFAIDIDSIDILHPMPSPIPPLPWRLVLQGSREGDGSATISLVGSVDILANNNNYVLVYIRETTTSYPFLTLTKSVFYNGTSYVEYPYSSISYSVPVDLPDLKFNIFGYQLTQAGRIVYKIGITEDNTLLYVTKLITDSAWSSLQELDIPDIDSDSLDLNYLDVDNVTSIA